MLTSAPRHLALVTFFTVCVILYFLIGPSQRFQRVQSTQEVGHKYSHSPNHPHHTSIPDSSPKLPDIASHDQNDHAINLDSSTELPNGPGHDHDDHASISDSSPETPDIAAQDHHDHASGSDSIPGLPDAPAHDHDDHASTLPGSPELPDAPAHDHDDHASTLPGSPELPDFAHHHHSIVPTKAPVPPPPSPTFTADDKESAESRLSVNEDPDEVDPASTVEEVSAAALGKLSHEAPNATDLEPQERSISSLPLGRASKIHQVILMSDGEGSEHNMYERALKGHLAYGERFGYETHVLRENLVVKDRKDDNGRWQAGVFRKPLDVLSLLNDELAKPVGGRAEWIAWVDADTIILNPNIPFDAFLPPTSDTIFEGIHFVGSQDGSGFNCGVFFMRVNEWSANLLTDVSALPAQHPDMHLSDNPDQDALKYLLQQDYRQDNVVYEPQHWFNSYPFAGENDTNVTPGDLLIHFAGMDGESRIRAMSQWLEKAEKETETYAVPFEKTNIMDEIGDFWNGWKEAKTLLLEIELGLKVENTTTKYEAYRKLQTAIRMYPCDKKRVGEVMREVKTFMGNDTSSEGKEMVHSPEEKKVNVKNAGKSFPIVHKHNGVNIQEVEIPAASEAEHVPIEEKEHDQSSGMKKIDAPEKPGQEGTLAALERR